MPKGNPNPQGHPRWQPGVSANPGGAPRGKRISTAMAHLMEMTPDELAKFRKRKDLVGADLVALAWYDKIGHKIAPYDGQKLLDMALDRTEGKVTEVHKIIGAERANLTDDEIDELWRRRQSRQTK